MTHEQQGDRPPRSMNDLLKLSIKYHETEVDRTTAPSAAQLDPERRQFLEDALRSLTTDEIENMKRSITTLQRPEHDEETQADIEEKEGALSLIHDIVDNLDNARGFFLFTIVLLRNYARLDSGDSTSLSFFFVQISRRLGATKL